MKDNYLDLKKNREEPGDLQDNAYLGVGWNRQEQQSQSQVWILKYQV